MRVLLREKKDDALTVVEAIKVDYDPQSKELCIYLPGDDGYTIEDLTFQQARELIDRLFKDGIASATDYLARYYCPEDNW